MTPDEIKNLILEKLPDAIANISSDDNYHFSAIIVAKEFIGKTKVAQQRLIYSILDRYIAENIIHAFSMKTFTPDEWAASST